VNKSFLEDTLYKSALEKAQKTGSRKPDHVLMQLSIPIDCYEAFIQRFYTDPTFKFKHSNNKVTKTDIVSNLLWLWGTKFKVDLSGNIFEQLDPGSTRVYQPNRKPDDKRGRKPKKALISLFDVSPVSPIPEDSQEQKKEE